MIGSVPPERVSSGRIPIACSNASSASRIAGDVGIDEPRRRSRPLHADLRAGGCRVADELLRRRADRVDVLPRREPDGELAGRVHRQRRVPHPRLAAEDPVHVRGRLGPRAHVELLRRLRVERLRALGRELCRARAQRRPLRELLRGRRHDSLAQRLRQPSVRAGENRVEAAHEHVDGVERGAAVHPGVQVALAGAHRHVEGDQPARREVEDGDVHPEHAAVEDDRHVRAAVVDGEVVDDRVAADLLLPVAGEAEVDRERVRLDEPLRRLEQDPDLALVVGDPARVRPLVADGQLVRVGLPEVERRRRLHVEVPVAEHRRRGCRIVRRGNLAERELLLPERRQLRGAADPPDEVADPLARPLHVLAVRGIRAHARDRDELLQLLVPGLIHEARLYASSARRRRADRPRRRG